MTNKKNNKNKVEQVLVDLYQSTSPFLEQFPWEFENDRWCELIISSFICIGIEPNNARKAVMVLKDLEMTSAQTFADASDEQLVFIQRVLLQADISKLLTLKAIGILVNISRLVNEKWNGFIQRFLRAFGEKMAQDLSALLMKGGLEKKAAKKEAVLWLQNVTNLPILLPNDPHIKTFCTQNKLSESKLIDILDDLGLNVCVADDLLALKSASTQKRRRVKASK